MNRSEDFITVALTGASGSLYAMRLIEKLLASDKSIYLVISDAAMLVLKTEMGFELSEDHDKVQLFFCELFDAKPDQIQLLEKKQWCSPIASGCAAPKKMVICPASMGTISAIAQGASNNLIERAADVVIKEKGKLIVVPRETPYSKVHLRNMLTLAENDVTVLPASPGFYNRPKEMNQLLDFIVARIFAHLGISYPNSTIWPLPTASH